MTFAETFARIKAATQAVFGHRKKYRELPPEEQRAVADKWLALILKSYVMKAAGEPYNGQRWEKRVPAKSDDGHLLLIKTGKLYNAVKNSTVTVYQGKKGKVELHAEVASKPYRRKGNGKQVTTKDVFLVHQYGTLFLRPLEFRCSEGAHVFFAPPVCQRPISFLIHLF